MGLWVVFDNKYTHPRISKSKMASNINLIHNTIHVGGWVLLDNKYTHPRKSKIKMASNINLIHYTYMNGWVGGRQNVFNHTNT